MPGKLMVKKGPRWMPFALRFNGTVSWERSHINNLFNNISRRLNTNTYRKNADKDFSFSSFKVPTLKHQNFLFFNSLQGFFDRKNTLFTFWSAHMLGEFCEEFVMPAADICCKPDFHNSKPVWNGKNLENCYLVETGL